MIKTHFMCINTLDFNQKAIKYGSFLKCAVSAICSFLEALRNRKLEDTTLPFSIVMNQQNNQHDFTITNVSQLFGFFKGSLCMCVRVLFVRCVCMCVCYLACPNTQIKQTKYAFKIIKTELVNETIIYTKTFDLKNAG